MSLKLDFRRQPLTPFSLFFTLGALVLSTASLWWTAQLTGLIVTPDRVPAVAAHALLMTFGFFPAFFAGFFFTTGVKWLRLPEVQTCSVARAAGLLVCGWTVFALALLIGQPHLLAVGLALVAAAWAFVALRAASLVCVSREADKRHAAAIAVAFAIGAIATTAAAVGAALEAWQLLRTLVRASLWGFVGIVFVAAGHRMVPFLSSVPLRHRAALGERLMLPSLAATFFANGAATLFPKLRYVAAGANAVMATVLLVFAVVWLMKRSLRPKMLRMLFAGFLWLALSLLLSAFALASNEQHLGIAALHAFSMGFLGTIMLAMLSRLAAAQFGRTVVVDPLLWRLFWLLQLGAVIRLAGSLMSKPQLVYSAGLAWTGAWCIWTWRLGTPRHGQVRVPK